MALIVGLPSPSGEPFAARAWAVLPMPTLPDGATHLRVLLDREDAERDDRLGAGAPIAVTGACVRTFESAQVKGRVVRVDDVAEADLVAYEQYREAYFTAIVETDGIARELLERRVPDDLLACEIELDEAYDQTPGPAAGAPLHPPIRAPRRPPGGGPTGATA